MIITNIACRASAEGISHQITSPREASLTWVSDSGIARLFHLLTVQANSKSPSCAMQVDTDDQVENAVPGNTIPSFETIQYSSEENRVHSKPYRPMIGSRTSNKTTQVDGPPEEIPIAAPVPLLYSARSRAVLRSMMSSGPVEGTIKHSSGESGSKNSPQSIQNYPQVWRNNFCHPKSL